MHGTILGSVHNLAPLALVVRAFVRGEYQRVADTTLRRHEIVTLVAFELRHCKNAPGILKT